MKINVNCYENDFIFYIFHLALYVAVKCFCENVGLVLRSEKNASMQSAIIRKAAEKTSEH